MSKYADARAANAAMRRRQVSGDVTNQRKKSLVLLWFGIARTTSWLILGSMVALGLMHVGPFDWAAILSRSVPFVALISIYANAATDFDAVSAAFAALVAADAHKAAATAAGYQVLDTDTLMHDIARLAELEPGDEGFHLSADIRARLRPGATPVPGGGRG